MQPQIRHTNSIGDKWETICLQNWFPDDCYELIDKTHNDAENQVRKITSSRNPDLKLRDRSTGNIFYVECKYRSQVIDDLIKWTNYEHLKRYQIAQCKYPVFVALHLDLFDNSKYYLLPLSLLSYPEIYKSRLKGYDRQLYPVASGDLWRLLK
ncbi:MAG: hypothetical protein BGP13_19585 [Sphingobacteriales bacterium 40-81]|nr:MAG: hypothetical protein BGP13_19585 [Sphingobacteriales bacterium 40-81]